MAGELVKVQVSAPGITGSCDFCTDEEEGWRR